MVLLSHLWVVTSVAYSIGKYFELVRPILGYSINFVKTRPSIANIFKGNLLGYRNIFKCFHNSVNLQWNNLCYLLFRGLRSFLFWNIPHLCADFYECWGFLNILFSHSTSRSNLNSSLFQMSRRLARTVSESSTVKVGQVVFHGYEWAIAAKMTSLDSCG